MANRKGPRPPGVNKGGRPSHKPTQKTRTDVSVMCFAGIPQAMIGKILKIDSDTLAKHYRDELDTALAQRVALVAGALHKNAMNGNVAAQIFVMKTQGSRIAKGAWRETMQLTGEDGTPLMPAPATAPPVVQLIFTDDPEPEPAVSNVPK